MPRYYVNLFSQATWEKFRTNRFGVASFPQSKLRAAQRVRVGDLLLGYVTGRCEFVTIQRVTGEARVEDTKLYDGEQSYPVQIPIEPVITVSGERGIPIHDFLERLSFFHPGRPWSHKVLGSLTGWDEHDSKIVQKHLEGFIANER